MVRRQVKVKVQFRLKDMKGTGTDSGPGAGSDAGAGQEYGAGEGGSQFRVHVRCSVGAG